MPDALALPLPLPLPLNLNLNLPLLDAALRGMLLALLALLAAVLVRERPALPAARVGVLMALGLGLQVVSATPAFEAQVSALWQAPLIAVSVANAVLFWVFVQALFDDDFALRPVHAIAWGGVAGLSLLNCLLNCVLPGLCQSMPGGLNLLLHGVQRAVPLVFAVLALVAALAHWRGDLVEGRRRLRWFIVGAGAAYTLVMLAARLGSPRGRLSAVVSSLDVLMLLLMLAVMAWGLLGLGRSEVFAAGVAERPAAAKSPDRPTTLRRPVVPVVPVAPLLPVAPPLPLVPLSPVVPLTPLTPLLQPLPPLPPLPPEPRAAASADPHTAADPAADPDAAPDAAPAADPAADPVADPAEDRLAGALQRLMADDRAYRDDGLSVASLAARLRVPEYRLRRLINQRLGHRNFNAFVNGWRLAEVRAALADPAQREVPVLTLAMDAGFQSIGPFNRAFKAATGLTPTEFRRAAQPAGLADC